VVVVLTALRAVVSGDDYLDGDYDDELDYDAVRPQPPPATPRRQRRWARAAAGGGQRPEPQLRFFAWTIHFAGGR